MFNSIRKSMTKFAESFFTPPVSDDEGDDTKKKIAVDRELLIKYATLGGIIFFTALICCFIGLILLPLYYYWFAPWFNPQWANRIRYSYDDKTLYANRGLIVARHTAVPLEKITDLCLIQGPIMRYYGIWSLQVQTAGSSMPEATLLGVIDPERVRTEILVARDRIK